MVRCSTGSNSNTDRCGKASSNHSQDNTYRCKATTRRSNHSNRINSSTITKITLGNPNSKGSLTNWGITGGGNAGGGYAIDLNDDATQVATFNAQHAWMTTSKWGGFSDISPYQFEILYQELYGKQQVWINPNDTNFVYLNTQNVWRYDRSTTFWNNISFGWPITNGIISAMGFALEDSKTFYVGSSEGFVWVTRDFGQSYKRIDQLGIVNGLPGGGVSQIAVKPGLKNDVVVSLGGVGHGHLYHCANTALATPVWTNISGAGAVGTKLPDSPANDVARSYADPTKTFYVANNTSVWTTIDGGVTWSNIGSPYKLPQVVIRRLALNGLGVLNAATFGRGMFRTQVEAGSGGGGGGGGGGQPNLSWSFSKIDYVRGQTGTITLKLDAAYAADLKVTLTSSDPARVQVPASVTFKAGTTTQTATITIPNPVADGTATITATMGAQVLTQDITVHAFISDTDTASSVTIAGCKLLSGSVLLTKVVDGQEMKYQLTPAAGAAGQQMSSTFVITATQFTPLTMQVLADFTVSDVGNFNPRHNVDIYDWSAAKWVTVGSVVGGVTKVTISPMVGGTLTRFQQASTHSMQVRIVTQRRDTLGTSSIIKVGVDRIAVKFQY